MFVSLFITFSVALAVSTFLLVTVGHRIRFAFSLAGIALGAVIVVGTGELVARLWALPANSVLLAQAILLAAVLFLAITRRSWNPIAQVFFATFLAAIGTYIFFAFSITFAGELSAVAFVVSLILLGLELFALSLASYFVFEGCDMLCRVRPLRAPPTHDPAYQPKVSLQVAAYNEPPDMLIETIRSIEQIDYPNLEIVVIDNNTTDPDLWRPVEDYCRDRPRVKFIHKENLEGFKAGALNLVMAEHMDADSEIIGVIDADYRIDPSFLKTLVGYFADPQIAFVQTPQDYRDHEGNTYLTACYDAYNYFFDASMPFRNERNSIIFAGTMGLIRRSALQEIGGWPEWCITEDAETSFRLLKRGYSGWYVRDRFGKGIMPLTFSAFKGQRFRWAFGGIQILKKHIGGMLPGPKTVSNQLDFKQRFDYLISGLMWFNDLLYLGFSAILFASAIIVLSGGSIELRPLRGAIVFLPAALIASGVVRALWSLRLRTGIGFKRSLFAFLNWLSLSWTVALACIQHLFRSQASFLRTPKEGTERSVWNALRAAKAETAIALLLWAAAVAVVASGRGTTFMIGLFAWQGLVYASAPLMSWLNVRGELTPELEARRHSEHRRERLARFAPVYVGAAAVVLTLGTLFAIGGSEPSSDGRLLALPPLAPDDDRSPLRDLRDRIANRPTASPTGSPASSPSPSAAPLAEETAAPTTAPTAAPTAARTAAPTPAPTGATATPAAAPGP